MTFIEHQGVVHSDGIPNLHSPILRSGGNAFAIGRPSYTLYRVSMTFIDELVLSIAGIPDLHDMIPRARGNVLAIGRPPYTHYRIGMALIVIKKPFYCWLMIAVRSKSRLHG